jgi:hypothetical protein
MGKNLAITLDYDICNQLTRLGRHKDHGPNRLTCRNTLTTVIDYEVETAKLWGDSGVTWA